MGKIDLNTLSEIELKVICTLHLKGGSWFGYGHCYYTHNSILSPEGNIPNFEQEIGGKKGLSKVLKPLRERGIVKFGRGLMTDDGDVAGSGHAPSEEYEEGLEDICEKRGWL